MVKPAQLASDIVDKAWPAPEKLRLRKSKAKSNENHTLPNYTLTPTQPCPHVPMCPSTPLSIHPGTDYSALPHHIPLSKVTLHAPSP